jgi:hypothetical protein
MSSKNGKN